jgi:hypothetical protein
MTDIFHNSFERARRRDLQLLIQLAHGAGLTSASKKKKDPKKHMRITRLAPQTKKRKHAIEHDIRITVVERVDLEALKYLIDNVATIGKPDQRTKFLNYAYRVLTEDGEQEVNYYIPSYGFGRHYPDVVCLQGLDRRLRSTLARDLYWDIDVSNAHPVVLYAIAAENGWPSHCLRDYIGRREELLNSIPLPRKLAKQLMLQQMYGGVVRNFILQQLEKKTIEGTANDWMKRIPKFVFNYGAEVRNMSALVPAAYPDVAEAAASDIGSKKSTNLSARTLSILVQTRETEAVMAAIEFMQKRGWTLGVMMHDGFMVYKRDSENIFINQLLLNGLRQTVKDKCHLEIDFELKEFEAPYEIVKK